MKLNLCEICGSYKIEITGQSLSCEHCGYTERTGQFAR